MGNWVRKTRRRNLGQGKGAAAKEQFPGQTRVVVRRKERWEREAEGAESREAICSQQR